MDCSEFSKSGCKGHLPYCVFLLVSDLTRTNFDGCSVSPKLTKLVDILLKEMNNSKKRGIIFVKTRQLSTKMVKYMREIPDLNFLCPTEFLGQHATEGGKNANKFK